MLGSRWGSLRTKIIAWSFVPTALILLAVALVTFTAYQQVTQDLVIGRDRELIRLSAGQLAAKLTEYTNLLYTEARTADIYENDPAIQRAALKRAGNRLVVFDGGVLILNEYGTVVAAEPERPEILGQGWADRSYFRQMLRTPGPVFSNIVADGPEGRAVIVVAVPITGDRGEFLGAMVGMFRLGATTVSAFYGGIVKLRIGQSGSVYLVDGQGRVIYHSDSDRIGDDFSGQEVVQQVLSGQVDARRTRDLAGRDIVAGFAPLPGTPWGLVTEERWTALIRPSQGYRQFLLLLLALGVMVPVLVVAIGIRRITRPIVELIGAAQGVAEGDFGQTITASTGDEIEDLAKQFNRMSAQLQVSYAHLEQMVTKRTSELATLSAFAAVVSRSLNLDEILSDALDNSLLVMEVEAGAIYLLDNEAGLLTVTAQQGFSPQFVAGIDRLKVGEGFSGRVAQSGQPLVVRNISADPRLTRSVVREEKLHSLACVPIRSKGKVLGVLFTVTRDYREFTDQDVELLTAIGHQVGVAIENVRLFQAEQRRADQFRAISEVGRRITSILEIDEVLTQIVRLIRDTFDYYHVGIGLIEEDEVIYRVGAGILWDDPDFEFEPARLKVGQEGTTGWVADTGEPLLVPDVSQEPHYVWMRGSETRSELTVPVKAKGEIIGVLDVQSDQLDAFDESDLLVLQSLAHQAGVAIENARLFQAEQRRVEQFQVIGEVGHRITSILAIDELLHQIANLIQKTFNHYLVEIGLVEEGAVILKTRASRDHSSPFQTVRLKVGQEGIIGWVAATGEPLFVPDVNQEPRYIRLTETATRSELAIPIKVKGEVIGVMNVESDQCDAFDETDVTVLQSLANQSGVAIENARLLAAERRRADELDVLRANVADISAELELSDLLKAILERTVELMGVSVGELGLYNESTQEIRIVANHNMAKNYIGTRMTLGEGAMGRVAETWEPLIVQDHNTWPGHSPQYAGINWHSTLVVPLIAGGQLVGTVGVGQADPTQQFGPTDVHLLDLFAQQAAIAVRNAQLYGQTQQVAVLKERQRLARDLHDSATQSLYAVTMFAEAAARLLTSGEIEAAIGHMREVRETAQEALQEMRLLIFELRPPILEEEGLLSALQNRLEMVEGRSGLKTEFNAEQVGNLPAKIEEGLYRISQEVLNNILKHAQAHRVTIHLCRDQQKIILEIADDGIGFDPIAVRGKGGLGLEGMEERMALLGGQFMVNSKPGEGTTVRVEVVQ